MSYFDSSYTVGGVSYWSGFNQPTEGASFRPFSSDKISLLPGSHRPIPDNAFWKSRGVGDGDEEVDEELIKVDFFKSDSSENRKEHHTEEYKIENLVVRRGQKFKIKIILNAPFDKTQDNLQMIFTKGDKPQESKGTLVRVDLYHDVNAAKKAKRDFDWLGYIISEKTTETSAELEVSITSNADSMVGTYKVRTNLYKKDLDGRMKRFIKEEEEHIYVLFNPWNVDDQVYMANDDERNEYVLNETGKIWVGSAFWNSGRNWNFGQFEAPCLEAAVYLLESSYLAAHAQGNATLVARALSAMANCNDDDGVLAGNWSGNYIGGTSPSKWIGSVKILEEYMKTKRAVKYGQCWVFSGLLTTLCRALGIPTRSVTNFDSAHDSDYSMTIDTHLSEDGEELSSLDSDSVWNFHVWNEAYFRRPDLPKGYDGWQAIDATPQESSEGMMRCGPAPLEAIKQGNVFIGYDTKFIFAEVNADRVTWIVKANGDMIPVKEKTEMSSVGHQISTKQVGTNMLNDITKCYKHGEGSDKEREAVTRASTFSSRKKDMGKLYSDDANHDVDFEWKYEEVEGDINIVFSMHNTSNEVRNVFVRATANATYYTGTTGEKLGDTSGEGKLQPNEKTEHTLKLRDEAYLNMIDEDAKVKIRIFSRVTETKQIDVKQHIFEVKKYDPVLEVSNDHPKVGEKFTLTIKIKNPVKLQLTNGVIYVEGPGIVKTKEINIRRPISRGEEITETVQLTAKYRGKRELIVGFSCRQLSSITGSIGLVVESPFDF